MRRATLASVLAFLVSAGAHAQETTATLSGTVKDNTGATVPGATVVATKVQTKAIRQTATTSAGVFVLPALSIGDYELTVSLQGFKTAHVSKIHLDVDDRKAVSVVLEVGNLSEEITVEASGQLQTESGEVSNLVGALQMESLPLNGRDFNQLVEVVPGVSPDNGRVQGGVGLFSDTSVSVDGSQSNSNLYLFDGMYNLDSGGNGNLLVTPSVDSIEEFKILRNSYSAEFGGATGGVINVVTKSGGQQFHGSLFDFVRNDALDAEDPFLKASGQPKSKLTLNNFGVTLGGPVFIPGKFNTDKTSDFFFFSYEKRHQVKGEVNTATVPTQRQRQGILDPNCVATAGPCTPQAVDPFEAVLNEPNVDPSLIDPNAAAFLGRMPLPNAPYSNGFNWIASPNKTQDDNQYLARWDHYFGKSTVLTVRYVQMTQSLLGIGNELFGLGDPFPAVNQDWNWYGKNVIAKVTTNFGPRVVNDLLLGYSYNSIQYGTGKTADPALASRAGFTFTELFPETTGSFPTLNPVEVFGNSGGTALVGNTGPFSNRTDNFQVNDDVTITFGRHSLRTGVFARFAHKQEPANGGGNFTAGTFTFSTFSDLLLGNIATYNEEQTQNDVFDRQNDFAAYLQDTWKVRPNLTVDLGVRFQYISTIYSAHNNIANFDPGAYNPSQCSVAAITASGLVDPTLCNVTNGIITPQTPGVDPSLVKPNAVVVEPRVGIAYQPKDRLVLRAGFGLFDGHEAVSQTSSLGQQPPFDHLVALNNVTFSQLAPGQLSPFNPNTPQPTLYVKALSQNYPAPKAYQYSGGFQYQVTKDTVLEVNYVGTHQVNLGRNRNINQVPPQYQLAVAQGLINPDTVRPYLGYNIINMNERVGFSTYNSAQVYLSRRLSHGIQFGAAYTYSHNVTNTINQDTEAAFAPLQNAFDTSGVYLANQDVPHSFSLNYLIQLPKLEGSGGFARAVLGGWQFAGLAIFRSGIPQTICLDTDIAGTGTAVSYECQRPNLVGNPNLPSGQQNVNHWFNAAAFAVPTLGTFGNAPRNDVRLPGVNNLDLSLFKNFSIPWFGGSAAADHATLQFRAECFNLLNHVQYNSMNTTYVVNGDNSGLGALTSARDPRILQLAVKLLW